MMMMMIRVSILFSLSSHPSLTIHSVSRNQWSKANIYTQSGGKEGQKVNYFFSSVSLYFFLPTFFPLVRRIGIFSSFISFFNRILSLKAKRDKSSLSEPHHGKGNNRWRWVSLEKVSRRCSSQIISTVTAGKSHSQWTWQSLPLSAHHLNWTNEQVHNKYSSDNWMNDYIIHSLVNSPHQVTSRYGIALHAMDKWIVMHFYTGRCASSSFLCLFFTLILLFIGSCSARSILHRWCMAHVTYSEILCMLTVDASFFFLPLTLTHSFISTNTAGVVSNITIRTCFIQR